MVSIRGFFFVWNFDPDIKPFVLSELIWVSFWVKKAICLFITIVLEDFFVILSNEKNVEAMIKATFF